MMRERFDIQGSMKRNLCFQTMLYIKILGQIVMSVYIYNSLGNISQVIIGQFYDFTDSNCVFAPTVFPATLAKLELISDGVRAKE